jgi:short-subunit dehydrogenase/glyoxylase-like metal-dependent hydrolase (beta-lactamase superfamily II)
VDESEQRGPLRTDRSGPALAVVTGASRGIGLELARRLAAEGTDLVVCAEDPEVEDVSDELRARGVDVVAVRADLSTVAGLEHLVTTVDRLGRTPDALLLNAGVGVGGPFLGSSLTDQAHLVGLNVTALVHLTHRLLPAMVQRGSGRVLVTSSVAATMPAPYNATYAASKAFAQSFTEALRAELAGTGVSVTSLQPGPTDTDFFRRAGLEDSVLGRGGKDDPAEVARQGLAAMEAGRDHVVVGAKGHVQTALSRVLPERARAALHGSMSKPRPRSTSGSFVLDEVADGVHRIGHAYVSCYLVEGDDGRLMLVDTGLPAMWPMIGRAVRSLGRTPDDLVAVLLTHAHFDHTGNAARAREVLDLPVLVHPRDVELAAHPYRYAHENPRATYPLRHPRALPILGAITRAGGLRVRGVHDVATTEAGPREDLPGRPTLLHTPGHTDGHLAVHLAERDVVLSGDALVTLDPYTGVTGPQIVAGAATADSVLALASLEHIAVTGARIVLPGHGEPWTAGAAEAVARARTAGAH